MPIVFNILWFVLGAFAAFLVYQLRSIFREEEDYDDQDY